MGRLQRSSAEDESNIRNNEDIDSSEPPEEAVVGLEAVSFNGEDYTGVCGSSSEDTSKTRKNRDTDNLITAEREETEDIKGSESITADHEKSNGLS